MTTLETQPLSQREDGSAHLLALLRDLAAAGHGTEAELATQSVVVTAGALLCNATLFDATGAAIATAEPQGSGMDAAQRVGVAVSEREGDDSVRLPLARDGVALGYFALDRPGRPFSPEERAALEVVAALLAGALGSASQPQEPSAAPVAGADLIGLLDSIQDPIVVRDVQGAMQYANRAYRQLLAEAGLTHGSIAENEDLTRPRDASGRPVTAGESLRRALEGKESRLQRTLRMGDGRDRSFAVSGTPLRAADGTVTGVAIVYHEETERVQRERTLRLLDEVRRGLSLSGDLRSAARAVCRRVTALLDWVDMAAIYARETGGLALLAQAGYPPRAARLLQDGLAPPGQRVQAALAGNEVTVFQVAEDEPSSDMARRLIAASAAATFLNLPLISASHPFGVLTLGARAPHTPSRVELALLSALASQVAAELEAVRRRQEAEAERALLQTVLDQLPEGVLLFDAGGRLMMSNQRSREVLGQDVDSTTPLLGLAARYGLLQADGRPYQPGEFPLVKVFVSGLPVLGVEQLVRREDGSEVPVVSNVAPVRDPAGQLEAVAFVFQDITSLKEMDRLKDDFLSIAGHELRTPISSIRGLAQMALRRPEQLTAPAALQSLAAIREQTDEMTELIDDLLDVSRIRTGRLTLELEPLDLVHLLGAAVTSARARHDGPISLDAPAALVVSGDRARLLQVFANLLNNAGQYSPSRSPIAVTAVSEGGQAVVSVSDRGIGVPPEDLRRVFERFFRSSNATAYAGGLGLGLYVCREIVERHGGTIAVESTAGRGSIFSVRLPLLAVEPGV